MNINYYSFGMQMRGERGVTHGYDPVDYRYAFQGMEQDNEVSGNGNSYTTEFRQYDPRLGRWKSLDPLKRKQPSLNPYQTFNNNPTYFTDPKGLIGGPAINLGLGNWDKNPFIYYNPKGGKGNLYIIVNNPSKGPVDFGFKLYKDVVQNKLMLKTSFDVILASNIDAANELVDEYLEETDTEQLATLVYNDHGNGVSLRVRMRNYVDPDFPDREPENSEVYITSDHIYGRGQNSHVAAGSKLIDLLSKVEDCGNIVMATCQIGYYDDIGNAILDHSEINDVNLYLNGDNTKISYSPGHKSPFEGQSLTEVFDVGWKIFNKNDAAIVPEAVNSNESIGQIGIGGDGTIDVIGFPESGGFQNENEDGQ